MPWTQLTVLIKFAFIQAIKQLLFSTKLATQTFFRPCHWHANGMFRFFAWFSLIFLSSLFAFFGHSRAQKFSRNNGILIKRTNVTFWMTVWHCIYVLIITRLLITFLQQPINKNNYSAVIGIKRTFMLTDWSTFI